jgi:hypothetical protein
MARSLVTNADVIDAVDRLVKEVGPRLTLAEFCRRSGISPDVIHWRFGGWNRLREKMDLPQGRIEYPPQRKHYRQDIVEKLRELAEKMGEGMSQWEFCEYAGVSMSVIARRCGGWGLLRESAGLPRRVQIKKRISDNELLAEVHRVKLWMGKFPTSYQFDRLSSVSRLTVAARFGGWRGVEPRYRDFLFLMTERYPDATRREEEISELAKRTLGALRREGR